MKLLMIRSKWDLPDLSTKDFLALIRSNGFDGTELYLPDIRQSPDEFGDMLALHGLRLVVLITTDGATPAEQMRSLDAMVERAVQYNPIRINSHTGKDSFSLEDNIRIFRRSLELAARHGIPISHETHRGRALFSTISTAALLRALPELRLTADFSHWCCVHESLLQDQQEVLREAIRRTDYIHARIGHGEGPQVSDPRAPEWNAEVEAHLEWWEHIALENRKRGAEYLAVCPEFGPWPYMPTLPYTRQPVASAWEIVLYVKALLQQRLPRELIADKR